jgi:2-aminoethylphosphonate-pyruvate transaminase
MRLFFSSVVGEQNVLVISNGEFGERLVEISKIYNKNTSHIQYSWGQEFDLPNIEKYLQTNKVDIVAVVHHETSTGMLNPILKIGQMAKKYSMTYIVDAVSSAGAEQISIEKCKIDYLSTSASKAIGSLPGVSIVVGKISELEKIKNYEVKTIYLNLNKFYLFARNYSQTPNTPAVQSFFALDQALENITSKTDKHFQNINKITALCRAGLKKLGLKFILDKESTMSVVLTTVFAPEGVDVTILKRKLRDKNIIIYDGKGVFKNKAFQVSIIGNQNVKDIKYFLKSLKEVLETFKK